MLYVDFITVKKKKEFHFQLQFQVKHISFLMLLEVEKVVHLIFSELSGSFGVS